MKILHVVPTYLPARRYGGPIYSVHGLCKALVDRGHKVDVVTTNVDGPGVSDVPIDRAISIDGVSVRYFPALFKRLYWSPSMAFDASRYDIIHLHSVFLWPTLAAGRAARRAGVPYVVSPRGMLVAALIREKSRLVKTGWLRLFERKTLRLADAIHFTSQREWDDARDVGLALPSAFVVPNGVNLTPASGVERWDDLVLYLGRVNWKKGLNHLVAAMRQLPSARLVVAGNDEENYASSLDKAPNVSFIGHVEGDRKEKLLQSASLLVLPSISENFGNVILEAMAAGLPVVTTPEVGLAQDVSAARAGVVADRNADSLARSIAMLLADKALRAEMGMNGRTLVESRFTWPAIAEAMEEHYRCSIALHR